MAGAREALASTDCRAHTGHHLRTRGLALTGCDTRRGLVQTLSALDAMVPEAKEPEAPKVRDSESRIRPRTVHMDRRYGVAGGRVVQQPQKEAEELGFSCGETGVQGRVLVVPLQRRTSPEQAP